MHEMLTVSPAGGYALMPWSGVGHVASTQGKNETATLRLVGEQCKLT